MHWGDWDIKTYKRLANAMADVLSQIPTCTWHWAGSEAGWHTEQIFEMHTIYGEHGKPTHSAGRASTCKLTANRTIQLLKFSADWPVCNQGTAQYAMLQPTYGAQSTLLHDGTSP